MAERKKTKGKRVNRKRVRRTVRLGRRFSDLFAVFKRPQAEFKPDSEGSGLLKLLHITAQQRMILLRWALYCAVCLGALILQDSILSRIHIMGATVDLPVVAILMVTIIEGSEVGSLFALPASIVYHFSGSAPGAFCVGLITVLGVLLGLFRQQFWHRSSGSIIMCTSIAAVLYEIGVYAACLFLGLTRWGRLFFFLLTGFYNVLASIPLYFLVHRIGLIGGNTWKE